MAPSADVLLAHVNTVMLLWYMYQHVRRRRFRSTYIRAILRRREALGDYRNLVQELRLDPEYHFNYLRMTITRFEDLISKVGPLIAKKSTHQFPITVGARLAMTLRYLASGDAHTSIAFAYRVSTATVCTVIKETCEAIWTVLMPEYLKYPRTADEWIRKASQFNAMWNFPHCIGAIDGKHVLIQAPFNSGSNFFNYKGTFSIILMAVCDANYCFTLVDIGCPGRFSDGGIFANSTFGQLLDRNNLNVPTPTNLPKSDIVSPYVLVGDEAFPLKTYLMRPFPRADLQEDKRIFNYRLSRARRVIENAFGILRARWRIFSKPINAEPQKVISIVKACVCLHNYLKISESQIPSNERTYCPPQYLDGEDIGGNVVPGQWRTDTNTTSGMQDICRTGSNMSAREAHNIRNSFVPYFCGDGAIPWQRQRVNEGYSVEQN